MSTKLPPRFRVSLDELKVKTSKKKRPQVKWSLLESGLNSAESDIISSMQAIQARQVNVLAHEAVKRATAGTFTFDEIVVPYRAEAVAAVKAVLVKLYELGQKTAKEEILATFDAAGVMHLAADALDPTSDTDVLAFLEVRARAIVSTLADRLKGSMMRNVLDQLRRGDVSEVALKTALTDLSDRAIKSEASATTSEALNLGRDSVAQANAHLIKRAEYSAMLDNATCDPCGEADGMTFTYGSAEMVEHTPPYRNCDGRNRCRCVLIFTLEGES